MQADLRKVACNMHSYLRRVVLICCLGGVMVYSLHMGQERQWS